MTDVEMKAEWNGYYEGVHAGMRGTSYFDTIVIDGIKHNRHRYFSSVPDFSKIKIITFSPTDAINHSRDGTAEEAISLMFHAPGRKERILSALLNQLKR